MEDVVAGFRPLRGRYVWGVRVGDGALLRFELGPPSLAVEEYRTSGGELERTKRIGRRRLFRAGAAAHAFKDEPPKRERVGRPGINGG